MNIWTYEQWLPITDMGQRVTKLNSVAKSLDTLSHIILLDGISTSDSWHFPPKLRLCVTSRQWLVQTDTVFRVKWTLILVRTLWEINWFTAEQEAVAADNQPVQTWSNWAGLYCEQRGVAKDIIVLISDKHGIRSIYSISNHGISTL